VGQTSAAQVSAEQIVIFLWEEDVQLGKYHLKKFVEDSRFSGVIIGLICINAITLGLDTYPEISSQYGTIFELFDKAILLVFTVELTLKIFVSKKDFFKDPWNVFDFLVVTISWVPTTGALSVLRVLRVLRVMRLLSLVPEMKRVLNGLVSALPGMGSVIGVLMLVFYICSVLATKLFGSNPDPLMQQMFGSLGSSAFTLFQVMTLDSWAEIARPTMALYPMAWLFFIPFIVATSFAVLNLFIGLIVDAMSRNTNHENEADRETESDQLLKRLRDIESKLDGLMNTTGENVHKKP
jgi:voltage-gated sodium channel|tara:strand:- start:177 stop:1061 length:885 start_codon:yes stop_codon:yes gene_type:complete